MLFFFKLLNDKNNLIICSLGLAFNYTVMLNANHYLICLETEKKRGEICLTEAIVLLLVIFVILAFIAKIWH